MTEDTAARRRWMSILARTPVARLEEALAAQPAAADHTLLRRPEIGSALVRARAGGSGQRFNMGEMTVTRCSVRLADGTVGHAYVAGRSRRQAELAAVADALMQTAAGPALEASLIAPQEAALAEARAATIARAQATRVEFFTMVRGED